MSDAPEPDVIEQSQIVDPPEEHVPPRLDPEVPEADALEQSEIVPDDDDYGTEE